MSVMKVETDIITSIAESLTGQDVVMYIETSAWNGQSPSRQMRLTSYSGDQKLLQIR